MKRGLRRASKSGRVPMLLGVSSLLYIPSCIQHYMPQVAHATSATHPRPRPCATHEPPPSAASPLSPRSHSIDSPHHPPPFDPSEVFPHRRVRPEQARAPSHVPLIPCSFGRRGVGRLLSTTGGEDVNTGPLADAWTTTMKHRAQPEPRSSDPAPPFPPHPSASSVPSSRAARHPPPAPRTSATRRLYTKGWSRGVVG